MLLLLYILNIFCCSAQVGIGVKAMRCCQQVSKNEKERVTLSLSLEYSLLNMHKLQQVLWCLVEHVVNSLFRHILSVLITFHTQRRQDVL